MKLDTNKLKRGMVLSENILSPAGAVILPKNTVISDSHIELLTGQNIPTVNVIEVRKPTVKVVISNDKMNANIVLYPPDESETAEIDRDYLIEQLKENGVTYGISETLIAEIVEEWNSTREAKEYLNIAKGLEPEPEKEGGIELKVKCIDNETTLKIAQKVEFAWQLLDESISFQRVDNGTLVAEKIISTPAIPGKNVLNEDLINNEKIKVEIKTDGNIRSGENGKFYSQKTGIAFYIKNKLGIIPLCFDSSVDVDVDEQNMKGYLIIHPAVEGGNPPKENDIAKAIVTARVSYGVKQDTIKKHLQLVAKGEYPKEPILIAEGDPPQDGKDAILEYLFETEKSLTPQEDSSGNVNYKNLSIIQTVSEGTPVAKITPPTKSIPGKDIAGKTVTGKDGKDATLPLGENTKQSEEDPNVLIAAVDGNVSLNSKKLVEINEGFVVDGNVDYSTGNIEYEKSVIVKEDVKSGFNINCQGDLEVGGTIEDCQINVGGSVLCKYGFVGQEEGKIYAKRNVNVGFIKNQTIYSEGDINIAKEAINPKLYASRKINLASKTLSVAGGELVAGESIHLHVCGNDSGIKTKLEVGLDFKILHERDKTEKLKNEIIQNRKKLVASTEKFDRLITIKKKLEPKDEQLYKQLKSAISKYDIQLKTVENRLEIINKKMIKSMDNSFIKVERSAMPGTIFKIGERQHIVRDEVIGPKTVKLINFEIHII